MARKKQSPKVGYKPSLYNRISRKRNSLQGKGAKPAGRKSTKRPNRRR